MIDIVVFGKPRSFESFEFEFEGKKLQNPENSHIEPSIRPKDFDEPIFHYYSKNGIVGWEVYRRCRGFDSDRQGIVFGVGIKSDKGFGLIDSLRDILMPYWEVFAQAFLDKNNKFQFDSIVGFLKTTKWGSDDEEKICSKFSNDTFQTGCLVESPLLLALPNIDELKSIESTIKEYNDVYIASRPEIFRDPINNDVLIKQANNVIHVVKNGNIEILNIGSSKEEEKNKGNGRKWTWIWGGNSGSTTSSEDESKDRGKGILPKLIAVVITGLLITAGALYFFKKPAANNIKLARPESGYIKDSFNLQPTFLHGESKKTSTRLEDIDWKMEGDGLQYVEWNPKETYFKINKNYYQNKPRQETQVTVTAILGDKELGKETYKIEKYRGPKANKVIMAPCRALMKVSWSIDPVLFYDNDPNVSTDLSEIQFTVSPPGIAHVDNEYKLVVDDRPDNDTQVTVTALLEGKSIGEQIYTIAKKDTFSPPPSIEKGSIICRKLGNNFDPTSISFTSRTIEQYVFIAIDKNGNQLSGGTWSFGNNKIHIPNRNVNPVSIGIGEGFNSNQTNSCKVSYKINNNTIAETTITITQ